MNTTTTLAPLFSFLDSSLSTAQATLHSIPGSAVLLRYIKSSHQNDPGRTLLELILVLFAIRTLLQSRTRADRNGKHFIQFSEKEVDELVDEWIPEPLAQPLTTSEESDLAALPVVSGQNGPKPKLLANGKQVINLASYNFAGLANSEALKEKAVETLRKYGLGSCGPPGFYGTLDVHMDLENDIADFLGTEGAILYSQGFSTVSSVIPAFCKRGDIIVADRGVNFAIQKGIQISRSTVRWYDHNDVNSLEEVLVSVEKERKKRRGKLTRRFIITEGIFAKDGQMVDLPKLIDVKYKYKYRLILDESLSFGAVGRTGRGLTELYNVPASKVDMILGSVANGLASCGGFCAGSRTTVEHQRINGPSVVFSASMPALLAVCASEAINTLRSTPSLFETLQENVRTLRAGLEKVEGVEVLSHLASPVVHVCIKSPSATFGSGGMLNPTSALLTPSKHSQSNPTSIHGREAKPNLSEYETEERVLQEIVEECLAQGVMLTRAKRLKGHEMSECRPSIKIAVSAAMSRKELEKAVGVFRGVVKSVLGRRK
ncbi:serine palmitoyltransferase [Panaeolus papilionaceus]|nr:serine palmitoyltransferase [Panaeolus papilionaceus]